MISKTNLRAIVFAGQAATLCCLALPWDDPFEQYVQRKNGVTLGAGDAREVNSTTHIIDPWPRYVRNTRIPGDGARMSGAIERYRDVSKIPNAPRPIQTEYDSSINIQGGAGK